MKRVQHRWAGAATRWLLVWLWAIAAPAFAADAAGGPYSGKWVSAFAAYGAPRYAAGFDHFDYVNPDAPKRGTLYLRNPDRRSSFDKYNPFTVRGNAPAGVEIWMFESLAQLSQDEPRTMYGLLAESMLVAPDMSAITFRINAKARFNNGDPVRAEDVAHSFRMLTSKQAAPSVQTALSGIERVVVLDERTVRFDLREHSRDQLFIAGGMSVFSHKWGDGKPLDQIVTEFPVVSGPYLIDTLDMPRRIEFKRDPGYWAADHPVRRGHFNFDRVVYRYYLDMAVAREAFKAGEFDIFKEYSARSWIRQHQGDKWDDGRIVKRAWETAMGQGLQAYNINLRRPKFQDIRVREALGLTYDFDTAFQKTGLYKRANSVFNNSPFAAEGLPSAGELALLQPYQAELPARVFGPAFVAPSTGGDPKRLRANLLHARALLHEAGWNLGEDGRLRNAKGEAMTIEYMSPRELNINDWQRNLDKLGIELSLRVVDFALYRRRLDQYDFDMVAIVEPDFTLPKVTDLISLYGSKSADEEGNSNFRGVKSRVVDRLLDVMGRATTQQALQDAARAFDRVVMWSFFQIPDLYSNSENFSYWNRFGIPQTAALYFAADSFSGDFGPWPLWTWWIK